MLLQNPKELTVKDGKLYNQKKILLSLVAQRELKHNGGIQVMYSEIITSHLNEMVADCGYIENVKRKKVVLTRIFLIKS